MNSSAERGTGVRRGEAAGVRRGEAAGVRRGEAAGVLRGEAAAAIGAARLDTNLRGWRPMAGGELRAEVREEARATGYAAGWAEGRRAVTAQARAQLEADNAARAAALSRTQADAARALGALAAAATQVERRSVPAVTEISDTVLAAALALAEAIVGRELAVATEPGADALQRALDLAPRQRPVVVRLHPEDLASLSLPEGVREIDGRTVTLLADPGITPGGALAECDATQIDARLDAALARAREVLGL
jgi:flagellar assembly protein FliH